MRDMPVIARRDKGGGAADLPNDSMFVFVPAINSDYVTFWDLLAERAKPAGLSAVVEDRNTVVRVVTGVLIGSVLSAAVQAAAFFWFSEPLVGWSSVVLGMAYVGDGSASP